MTQNEQIKYIKTNVLFGQDSWVSMSDNNISG